MFSRRYMIYCVALSVLIAGCATTPAGSPTVNSGAVVVESEDFRAAIVFGDSDRRQIRHYYKNRDKKTKALPPGLAKKHESHPGLRNHIRKYRDLPPGIQGKRLPVDLRRTLQPIPEGNVRIRVGGDILLMNERTRYVLDVIFDVD